jgi:hypothetical protein
MSDETDYEDEDPQDEQPTRKTIEVDAADWRATRKKAKQVEELEGRATAAERKLAVRDAGLDISPRQLSALLKEHDGEFTAEALQATAAELGFWKPPEDTEVAEDAAAMQRMNAATSGATAPVGFDKEAAIAAATSPAEVLAAVRAAGGLVASDIE